MGVSVGWVDEPPVEDWPAAGVEDPVGDVGEAVVLPDGFVIGDAAVADVVPGDAAVVVEPRLPPLAETEVFGEPWPPTPGVPALLEPPGGVVVFVTVSPVRDAGGAVAPLDFELSLGGEVSVPSAWAIADPLASAAPNPNITTPVPSHLYGSERR